jgi:hypothetical protein
MLTVSEQPTTELWGMALNTERTTVVWDDTMLVGHIQRIVIFKKNAKIPQ